MTQYFMFLTQIKLMDTGAIQIYIMSYNVMHVHVHDGNNIVCMSECMRPLYVIVFDKFV